MYPETLLPQSLLVNAALYAAIALIYSGAFFVIDRILPGRVFYESSNLRDIFSYIALCSWPVLLFGGLILIAVRVGANVRRRKRRRRGRRGHSRSSSSKSISRSGSNGSVKKKRRASSAPPSVIPPGGRRPVPDVTRGSKRVSGKAKRHHSDYVRGGGGGAVGHGRNGGGPGVSGPLDSNLSSALASADDVSPPSTSASQGRSPPTPPSTSLAKVGPPAAGESGGMESASGGEGQRISRTMQGSRHSARSSKRSKSSRITTTSDLLPRGFVSVTRAQKAFAAMGFLWLTVGLAATAAIGMLVFFGMRENYSKIINQLHAEDVSVGVQEWVIVFFSGGIFFLLFGALAFSTLLKFFKALGRTPADMEIRTVSLDDGAARGADIDLEAGYGSAHRGSGAVTPRERASQRASRCNSSGRSSGRVRSAHTIGGKQDEGSEDEETDDGRVDYSGAGVQANGDGGDGDYNGRLQSPAGTSGDLIVDMEVEDWRSQYRRGSDLPYQADEQTVERMMRQLRDMGFTNPHQNIAALQASSFDLEIASDKLANARMA